MDERPRRKTMSAARSQRVQRFTSAIAPAAIALAAITVSVVVLRYQFGSTSMESVARAFRQQSADHIATALLLTVTSYTLMAMYDVLCARFVAPTRASRSTAFFAGATANAISNTLGFHAITATAIRARVYGKAGIALGDIARIVALCGGAVGLSFAAALAAALLAQAIATHSSAISNAGQLGGGLLLVAAIGALFVWLPRGDRTISLAGLKLTLPTTRIVFVQLLCGLADMAASIGVLYVLLPPDLVPSFATFSIAMVLSLAAGVAGNAPGGIGVFDAALVAAIGAEGRADAVAALVMYRIAYLAVPFVLSATAIAIWEIAALTRQPRAPRQH